MQERKQNEIVNCWIDIDLVGEIIFLGQCNNEIFNGLRSSRSSRLGNKKNMDSTLKMNLSCTHLLLFLDVTRIVLKAVMGSVPWPLPSGALGLPCLLLLLCPCEEKPEYGQPFFWIVSSPWAEFTIPHKSRWTDMIQRLGSVGQHIILTVGQKTVSSFFPLKLVWWQNFFLY